jgi:hypothetical protein
MRRFTETKSSNIWVLLPLVFASCASDPETNADPEDEGQLCEGSEAPYEPVPRGSQDFDLNLSLFLDLSDRIDSAKYPDKAMPYHERDLGYIESLGHGFARHGRARQLRRMNERFQVFFDPPPADPEINTVADDLKLHWTKNTVTKEDVCDLVPSIKKGSERIYQHAMRSEDFTGSDIWNFFHERVKRSCIQPGSRNVLVILTDGYMYAQNNKRENGTSRWSNLTAQKVRSLKLTGKNWEELVKQHDYGFLTATEGLSDLEVIVIGVRPSDHNGAYEADVLKHFWTDWMTAMGVKRFEFVKTDLPSNVDQWLQNYVLGLN